MAQLFRLEVLTPTRQFFMEKVEAFTATISDGEIGVYAGRTPFSSALRTCVLGIKNSEGKWKYAAVSDGIVSVTPDGALILASTAEWPGELDKERAENSKKRAEERLQAELLKFEVDRAHASLARAMNRLKVIASYGQTKNQ